MVSEAPVGSLMGELPDDSAQSTGDPCTTIVDHRKVGWAYFGADFQTNTFSS